MKNQRLFALLTMLIMILTLVGVPQAAAENVAKPEVQTGNPACDNCAKLQLTKTADAAAVTAGDPVGYTIAVKNYGLTQATGVTVIDNLPLGLTWTVENTSCSLGANNYLYCELGNLDIGATKLIHVTAVTPRTFCSTISNTAQAWADSVMVVTSNTAEVAVTCGELAPDITVAKTAESATVTPGAQVRFTLTTTNIGTAPANGVILRDALPSLPGFTWTVDQVTGAGSCAIAAGVLVCDFGSVEVDGIRTVQVSSPTTSDSCGLVTNTATVSAANEAFVRQSNNEATASTTVDCPPPSVKILKTADTERVNLNQALGFSITVQNTGTTPVTNLLVRDTLAAGLTWAQDNAACSISTANELNCTFGTLAANATVTVHVTASGGAAVCGDLTNTAYVSGDNLPWQASNNAVVHVNCAPDLSITKVATPLEIQLGVDSAGQPITPVPGRFAITVNNHGTGEAQNVVITDELPLLVYPGQPANTSLVWTIATPPATGTCAINAGVLTCTFATLAAGASATVEITSPTSQIPQPTTTGSGQEFYIDNSVTVTSDNEPVENRSDNNTTARIHLVWSSPICISDPGFNGRYFDDFSGGSGVSGRGWSNYKVDFTKNGQNNAFIGRMTNAGTTLLLGCLPVNTHMQLSFDLYVIGSMDGNAVFPDGRRGPGPDVLKFLVSDPRATDPVNQGQVLLESTFTNWPFFTQAYPGGYPSAQNPAFTGAVARDDLGFDYLNQIMSSTYRIRLNFYNTRETQLFVFVGSNMQIDWDESWGIDNVELVTQQVLYLPVVGH